MGLYDWLTVESEAQKKRDFEEAKERLRRSRPVGMHEIDEQDELKYLLSSVGTEHGGGVAFPTLYPKEGREFGSEPVHWDRYTKPGVIAAEKSGVEGDWVDALKRAYAQDEAYEFRTEAEAEDFAAGSWKKGHYFSSPTGEYLPDPNYKPSVASIGTKIPDNLWKDLMKLSKDLSLDAQKTLHYNYAAELEERGEEIFPPVYNEDRMKQRYDPEGGNQVGYIMNIKQMQQDYKTSGAGAFYKNYSNKKYATDPDTAVFSPQFFYKRNNDIESFNKYGPLSVIIHENMHAGGVRDVEKEGFGPGKFRTGWGIGHPEGFASTTQQGYDRIIDALFKEKQRDIELGPKNEEGIHQPSFMDETFEAMKKWLESENLDVDYVNLIQEISETGEMKEGHRSNVKRLSDKTSRRYW